jgi:hypothetical protein
MRTWLAGIAAALCVCAFALFGCAGGGGGQGPLPRPQLSFFNGSPDAGDMDFFINQELAAAALAYLEASSFGPFDPGDRDIVVQESSTTTEIDSIFVNLARDSHYLVSLLGLLNSGAEPEKRARLVFDAVSREAPNGLQARVVIYHGFNAEAGFQTPNIDFQSPGSNPQFFVRNIEFASGRPLTITAGVHSFEARRNGTEHIYVTLNNFNFEAGKIYAAYVLGVENGVGNLAPRIEVVEIPSVD